MQPQFAFFFFFLSSHNSICFPAGMGSNVNFSSEVAVERGKSMWVRNSVELSKSNFQLQLNMKLLSHTMKHFNRLSPNLSVLSRRNPCISAFLCEKKEILCFAWGVETSLERWEKQSLPDLKEGFWPKQTAFPGSFWRTKLNFLPFFSYLLLHSDAICSFRAHLAIQRDTQALTSSMWIILKIPKEQLLRYLNSC